MGLTEPIAMVQRPTIVPNRVDDIASIYDECHEELFGYVASLTRDRDAAEDIVHEGFVRFVRERSSGRWVETPRAWLYRVCTNLSFSRSRRRAVADRWSATVGRIASSDVNEAAEDTVLRRERDTELHQALRSLPKDHQAALLLAADGFSGQEIASILGRSEGATRNILWRSRVSLKDRLEGTGR
jgi:RNA polymerase sigma-70 factor, ECF subfamily